MFIWQKELLWYKITRIVILYKYFILIIYLPARNGYLRSSFFCFSWILLWCFSGKSANDYQFIYLRWILLHLLCSVCQINKRKQLKLFSANIKYLLSFRVNRERVYACSFQMIIMPKVCFCTIGKLRGHYHMTVHQTWSKIELARKWCHL